MTADPPDSSDARSCAVCARVLNLFVDAATGERSWIHVPADQPEDHPAVPVPPDAIATLRRCDFCSADDPQWIVPARSFRLNIGEITGWASGAGSVEAWAACDVCAELVAGNRWTPLRRHVLDTYQRTGAMHGLTRDQLSSQLNRLWRQLRPNITGAPIHKETRP